MSSTRRKTCKRYDFLGHAHFLTFSCFKRLPLLNRDRSRRWMINGIELSKRRNPFSLWAYVIMPEHVHLLLLPGNNIKISNVMRTMKQSVSKCAIKWLKQNSPEFLSTLEDRQPNGKSSYRFWRRGGGYDRNVTDIEEAYEKINYIHENPVRRGLVKRGIEWYWSSASAWELGTELPLPIDRDLTLSLQG